MQAHGNRRLFDLAQRNQQRLQLAQLRRDASPGVCALWDAKALALHPETPAVLQEAYAWCAGLHEGLLESPRARLLRTASPERAYAGLLAEALTLPAGDFFASFGGWDGVAFDADEQWIPRLPVTRVTAPELVAMLRVERRLPFDECALVAASGSSRLVLSSYLGTLPHEHDPGETSYELAVAA